jgi:putative nucleotidyltransferase with HDIG domain
MQELDEYINKVKQLPPAPRILPQLLFLLGQPNTDSSKVVDLITFDPALTATVLQACNSAFFGAATPAADLQEAVTRLGFQQAYRIVAAVSGSRALGPAQKGYGIEEGELWKHSVTAAVAAQLLAKDLGDDESVVFTAALLHDIGKIILAQALEHIYTKLVQETESNQHSLLETEKKLLGVQHAEIGGRLLARWKFPEKLVSAVWFHHHPAAAEPHGRMAAYVYLGNMIAYFLGHGYGHQAFALRGRAEALELLGIGSDMLPRYMIQTVENLAVVEALFRIHC